MAAKPIKNRKWHTILMNLYKQLRIHYIASIIRKQ